MIVRRSQTGATLSVATYSGCERYRYLLTRRWTSGAPQVLFVMLNPSTADEMRNDPTIARCERRARDAGYGGYAIANLFGWRATRPGDLRKAADPVGPGNDRILLAAAGSCRDVICGWGVQGSHLGRGETVRRLLEGHGHALHHLGLTQAGHPRHPLYLPYSRTPLRWPAQDMAD